MTNCKFKVQPREFGEGFYFWDESKPSVVIDFSLSGPTDFEALIALDGDELDDVLKSQVIDVEIAIGKHFEDEVEMTDGDVFVHDYLLEGKKKMYLVEKVKS